MYATVLPPPGNTRKLQIKWSRPLVVLELVNNAMIKIKETGVKNPRTYIAHRSKLRLAKRMGQKDTDPLFKLPLLPKSEMDQLCEELEEFELPGKTNQEDVIVEIWDDCHKSHTGDDHQDDSTSSSCRASSRTKTSEDGRSNRSSDEFLSFHQSPGSVGSEASSPEQEFSRHIDLDELEPEVVDQALQDSDAEEEPVSAASQLVPDPEPVFEEPQSEELVPDHDLVRATIPEPEPEKYICLHITEEQTVIPQEFGSESSFRRKSNWISKPVEKFDSAQFKIPSITSRIPSITSRMPSITSRGRAKSTLKNVKSIIQEGWKERPTTSLNPRASSTSRESSASTKTRAASLEKLHTGSIKSSSKSKVSTRYQVENQVEQGEAGEESSWSNIGDEKENEKNCGGVNVILGQNLRIAKAKNNVVLQPRQGRWIPLSCNFDHRKNNEFLFPVLFNTLIERNLIASKISPQAGASRSCAIYIINNKDIFVQVKRGESLGRIISLEMQENPGAEQGD